MSEKPDWLKNLFRWEQKALCVNGHSMAYVDEGEADARPVVLLHGNPTWGFLYRDFVGPLVSASLQRSSWANWRARATSSTTG